MNLNNDNVLDSINFTEDMLSSLSIYRNYSYFHNLSAQLKSLSHISFREMVIIACYSLIVIVSVFGNLLVCNIVARKAGMRRTTYVFIANLAMSDFLMTVLNIPFNVARVLLDDWPFGDFMCSFVPLVQVTSVYVSTFTMMFIALDRYRVICKPLKPRLNPVGALKAIACVWLVAVLLALPHAIYSKIEPIFSYRIEPLIRCRTVYPENLSKWITLITVVTQYVLPLSITCIFYFFIVARVWSRDVLGVVTEAQLITRAKSKRKTIKMLVLVVVLFAFCWLPLNVYHLLHEFTTLPAGTHHSTIFFICHWLAMSSVCYNPFIYCWLNKNFRSGAVACFMCIRGIGQKINSSFRSSKDFKISNLRCDLESQSFDSRTESSVHYKDSKCFHNTALSLNKSKSLNMNCNNLSKENIQMNSFYEFLPNTTNENKYKDCHSTADIETASSISKCNAYSIVKRSSSE